jgi:hypothetical protein
VAETCEEVYDSSDEYSRDERIETVYQGWGAREMAERIVELEDELGADVDGVCTGMHADVAEAHAEIERLTSESRNLEGDCIRLSEELDEARADNVELAKRARDADHWEAVADRMRDEISRLKELLEYEHSRADTAIDREEVAEKAAEEAQADAKYFEEWAIHNGLNFNNAVQQRNQAWDRADRYRLAWLSARRRAADEANYGLEALDCQREETRRWRRGHEAAEAKLTYAYREIERLRDALARVEAVADEFGMLSAGRLRDELGEQRKTTDAPRLEYAGQDEDGEVWRLKEA